MNSQCYNYFYWINSGPKHRTRFLCEVRIPGLTYVGAGNSTTKKDAEKNAARDFVNFLVRTGQLAASDVPADALEGGGALPARMADAASAPVFQVSISFWWICNTLSERARNFQQGEGPEAMGQAYRPYNDDNNDRPGHSFVDRAQQQQRMEEAESLDMNAGIHGNWTIENAKAKLHQFMQMNKITADYKYSPVGPDHARCDSSK